VLSEYRRLSNTESLAATTHDHLLSLIDESVNGHHRTILDTTRKNRSLLNAQEFFSVARIAMQQLAEPDSLTGYDELSACGVCSALNEIGNCRDRKDTAEENSARLHFLTGKLELKNSFSDHAVAFKTRC
jgi:hypothetical protein